ncbi:hypothetical protein ASF24_09895 [Methylobacterium sp. Leaf86]|nr:hypothetical protein ASF24_09895 [Methylobacterium sp. Leaf86]
MHTGAGQSGGNRRDPIACRSHRLDPLAVEAALTAGIHATTLRALDAFALALLNEPSLHLRDHAEHGQNDVTHFASGRDVWVEHRDMRTALLGLVNKVQDISRVAAEPVQTRDHQFVAGPQELKHGRQFGPAISAATGDLLRTDDPAAFSLQPGNLPVEILIERTDTGVTDASHGL